MVNIARDSDSYNNFDHMFIIKKNTMRFLFIKRDKESDLQVSESVPNLISSGSGGGISKNPFFDLRLFNMLLDMKLSDCLMILFLRCEREGSGYIFTIFSYQIQRGETEEVKGLKKPSSKLMG